MQVDEAERIGDPSGALGGISVRRPTLDDVFLSLTGRQIRDEGAEGQFARLRAIARRRG